MRSENMQQIYSRTPIPNALFLEICFATLYTSQFGMCVLLYSCCASSEYFSLRTPLDGCFRLKFLLRYSEIVSEIVAAKIQYKGSKH